MFGDGVGTPFAPQSGSGAVIFGASLTGTGVTADNGGGLFKGAPGALSLVARVGDAAPGAGGAEYESFIGQYRLNGAGDVAFRALLEGPGITPLLNDQAIFGPDGAGISLYFQEGEVLPELTAGLLLGDFDNPLLNASGDLAVVASLVDGGDAFQGEAILFATGPDQRRVIVASGDVLAGRIVAGLDLFGGAGSLNDSGEIAFRAIFDDGSQGIFVASVPEAGGLALVLIAGLGGLAAARRSA